MASHAFDTFCAALAPRIRNPFARPAILEELAAHLEDRTEALVCAGLSPEKAEAQAVAALGDPETLGEEFNRVHNPLGYQVYRVLKPLAIAAVVLVLGVLLLDLLSSADLLRVQSLLEEPDRVTYDDSVPGLVPVAVTGGGKLGDYWLEPVPDFRLHVDGNAPEGELRYWMDFVLRISHWQPWLSGLDHDNLTLTGPDGTSVYADVYMQGNGLGYPGRLVGQGRINIHLGALGLDDLPLTLTLSSPDHAVQFTITQEEVDAP